MKRCTVLQFVQNYARIASYLWRYKGGSCDRNGGRTVAYCRGGSTKTAQAAIHRATVFTRRENTSVQNARHMAGQVQRPGQIHRSAEVPQTRGKLTKLALPVAPRISSKVVDAVNDIPCAALPVVILAR